jgi:hypothetical protein
MKQLFINVQTIYNGLITKGFGDKAITQLNFDDTGKIISLKCVWYRGESFNDDLFLTVNEKGKFVNEHGNLIGTLL